MTTLTNLLFSVGLVIATTGTGLAQASLPSTIGSVAESDQLESAARMSGDPLIPTCRFEGARCGYIDRSGKTVIAPRFDWGDRFVDGRAIVGSAGKHGAIDTVGGFAVGATYVAMSAFDRGQALVLDGDRLGVLDQDGRSVVSAEHGAIVRLTEDAFLVAEPPYVNRGGPLRSLGDRSGRSLPYAPGKRWGIVGRHGAWIVRPAFAQVRALSDDLDGLFWAAESAGARPSWRLMRVDGSAAGNESFDHVQQVQAGEDRAVVRRGGRWGAINGRGELAIDLKFDWLGYFRDGWAPYRLAGREGRVDRDGHVLPNVEAKPDMATTVPATDRPARDRGAPANAVQLRLPWSEGLAALVDDTFSLTAARLKFNSSAAARKYLK